MADTQAVPTVPRAHRVPTTAAPADPVPTESWITRLARFVLAHRRLVMIVWFAVFLGGAIGAGNVSSRLKFDFSLPGQPGYVTAQQITRLYGNGGQTPPSVVVVTVPAGHTVAGERAPIAAAFARARASVPGTRIVDLGVAHDASTFVTHDERTTYALVFTPVHNGFGAPAAPAQVQRVLGGALAGSGTTVGLTGLQQLASGSSSKGPGVFVETMIGALGALAVLAFVFASLLAFMPLLIAAVSILTTLLVVLGLTYVADVSFIVEFLVSLVGLGVAIDYSLLVVTRWREERARGRANHDAVVVAMGTAGRAVVLSGLTVAIGLVALVVLPVPGLRSVGYGGMLIPLVSTAVTLTLLPALLGGVGPRVDWPRVRHERDASRGWTTWTRNVVRHRVAAAAAALAILAICIAPVFNLTTGETSASALAKAGPAHDAYTTLTTGGVASGVLTPLEVLTHSGAAPAVRARLATVPGISAAVRSDGVDSNRAGTTVLLGIPSGETVNGRSLAPVRAARAALAHTPGVIGIAGAGALDLDYQHAVFGSFPLMFAIIALLTIVLLDARVPLARAGGQGGGAQPRVDGGRVRRDDLVLAGGPRLERGVRHPGHRRDHDLDPADDLRVPVRPVDGLRGVHPGPRARGVRPHRLHRRGGDRGARAHRPPRHERRPDPVPRLRVARLGAEHRRQGARQRSGHRHPARRDRHPGAAAARARVSARALELVAAACARAGAPCACRSGWPRARRSHVSRHRSSGY